MLKKKLFSGLLGSTRFKRRVGIVRKVVSLINMKVLPFRSILMKLVNIIIIFVISRYNCVNCTYSFYWQNCGLVARSSTCLFH